jgi:hypothetical protein
MDPAFFSIRQTKWFALLLLALLLLPLPFTRSMLPAREEVYSSLSTRFGPFHFIEQQIFHETSDVDIAFIGSSHMLTGIDTPYVQQKLSEHAHRPAVVITLGWGTAGFDGVYFVARDLLEHRRVHFLVIDNEATTRDGDLSHHISSHWFRFGEDRALLDGLPVKSQLSLYGSAILGMPRNLLGLVRPNLSTRWSPGQQTNYDRYFASPDPAERLGSEAAHLSYGIKYNFADYTPTTTPSPDDALLYTHTTKEKFRFRGPATSPYQLHFLEELANTARDHQTVLVMLHLPEIGEASSAAIDETDNWPAQHYDLIIGIPPASLFANLTREEITRLYLDEGHFNKNGQRYFTAAITPELLRLYDAAPPIR